MAEKTNSPLNHPKGIESKHSGMYLVHSSPKTTSHTKTNATKNKRPGLTNTMSTSQQNANCIPKPITMPINPNVLVESVPLQTSDSESESNSDSNSESNIFTDITTENDFESSEITDNENSVCGENEDETSEAGRTNQTKIKQNQGMETNERSESLSNRRSGSVTRVPGSLTGSGSHDLAIDRNKGARDLRSSFAKLLASSKIQSEKACNEYQAEYRGLLQKNQDYENGVVKEKYSLPKSLSKPSLPTTQQLFPTASRQGGNIDTKHTIKPTSEPRANPFSSSSLKSSYNTPLLRSQPSRRGSPLLTRMAYPVPLRKLDSKRYLRTKQQRTQILNKQKADALERETQRHVELAKMGLLELKNLVAKTDALKNEEYNKTEIDDKEINVDENDDVDEKEDVCEKDNESEVFSSTPKSFSGAVDDDESTINDDESTSIDSMISEFHAYRQNSHNDYKREIGCHSMQYVNSAMIRDDKLLFQPPSIRLIRGLWIGLFIFKNGDYEIITCQQYNYQMGHRCYQRFDNQNSILPLTALFSSEMNDASIRIALKKVPINRNNVEEMELTILSSCFPIPIRWLMQRYSFGWELALMKSLETPSITKPTFDAHTQPSNPSHHAETKPATANTHPQLHCAYTSHPLRSTIWGSRAGSSLGLPQQINPFLHQIHSNQCSTQPNGHESLFAELRY